MDWFMQLQMQRMVSLCMQEAREYERGRTLQVLQPSMASLLQPGSQQRPAVAPQQPGRPVVMPAPLAPVTATPPQLILPQAPTLGPTSSGSIGQQGVINIKQEAAATTQAVAVPAAPTAANVADALQAAAALCTPAPGAPQAAAPLMQTPISSSNTQVNVADAAAAAATPAVMLSGGLSSQQMALACNSVVRLAPHKPDAAAAAAAITAAPAPTATPQQFQLLPAAASGSTLVQVTPTLLQQQVFQQPGGMPLMQQVLQQQACSQHTPGNECKHEDSSHPDSHKGGKRKGYQLEPEALKRLVQRQLEVQRDQQQQPPDQQQEQEQDVQPDQQPDPQQQLAGSQLQQQQQAAPQRLQQQQQHRQRCLPRVPQQYKQLTLGGPAAAAAAPGDPAVAVLVSPGAAAGVGGLPSSPQLQVGGLESPDACLGLSLPCVELDQPVQLELDASKMFGSAQKRLRLSMCDEGHGMLPLDKTQPDLQLSAALISPQIAFPNAALAAAGAAAAAAAGDAAGPAGAGLAAAAPEVATPSKFFAGSPVQSLYVDGAADAAAAAPALPAPAFATPSKFFSGSPVPAAARRSVQGSTPETPLLFGVHASASPWPRQLDMQQAASSCPLRRDSMLLASTTKHHPSGKEGAAQQQQQQQPSSWVPIDSHSSMLAGTPDLAAVAAAPVEVGVFCTPLSAAEGSSSHAHGMPDAVDAATAAAAPVEGMPVKGDTAAAAVPAGRADAASNGNHVVGNGRLSLMTPPGHALHVQATPVTGL